VRGIADGRGVEVRRVFLRGRIAAVSGRARPPMSPVQGNSRQTWTAVPYWWPLRPPGRELTGTTFPKRRHRHAYRSPERDQDEREPHRPRARGRGGAGEGRPHRDRGAGRRPGQRLHGRAVHGRRRHAGRRGAGVGAGRDDHEGEGAHPGGVPPHPPGPGAVHLLPLRRRRDAHPGADRVEGGGHRVRDGAALLGRAPPADADERGGTAAGGCGWAACRAWRRPRW
jgi:hypothetical protein